MIIETELYLHLHTYHIMSLRGEVWAHKKYNVAINLMGFFIIKCDILIQVNI
jgi:hypothetical protein